MNTFHFTIENLTCASCVKEIESILLEPSNHKKVVVNFATKSVEVYGENLKEDVIEKLLAKNGYNIQKEKKGKKREMSFYFLITAIVFSVPFVLQMLYVFQIPFWLQLTLATPVQFVLGFPIYKSSITALFRGKVNMNTLVAIGTSAAYLYSIFSYFHPKENYFYFETSVVLITLILLGRFLEDATKKKVTSGMSALLQMQPKTAQKKGDNGSEEVPIDSLQVGDIVIIKAGEKIPVDGVIVKGETEIDESMLTGEPIPVKKTLKDEVSTACINFEGVIEVKVTKLGTNTKLGQIIKLVEKAQSSKAPAQKLADKVSSVFVPIVIGIAIVTFITWFFVTDQMQDALMSSVAVLVIACPCALGLATPIVVVAASLKATKMGVLIKEAKAIEQLSKVKKMVFDKTGTVTEGKLSVEKVEGDILDIAASIAGYSSHPISKAIYEYGKREKFKPYDVHNYQEIAGKGVSVTVSSDSYLYGSKSFIEENLEEETENNRKDSFDSDSHLSQEVSSDKNEEMTSVYLAKNGKLFGKIFLSDPIKSKSDSCMSELKNLGVETYLLSGDRKPVVKRVATSLMMDGYFGEVSPKDKSGVVEDLKKDSKVVAMVGDGVNDAIALVAADIGIALASGSDVAMENASIGLMQKDIMKIVSAIKLTRGAYRKMKQNIVFAFLYNIIGIPLAAFGILNPIFAGIAMGLSSISVVLNAMTVQKIKV